MAGWTTPDPTGTSQRWEDFGQNHKTTSLGGIKACLGYVAGLPLYIMTSLQDEQVKEFIMEFISQTSIPELGLANYSWLYVPDRQTGTVKRLMQQSENPRITVKSPFSTCILSLLLAFILELMSPVTTPDSWLEKKRGHHNTSNWYSSLGLTSLGATTLKENDMYLQDLHNHLAVDNAEICKLTMDNPNLSFCRDHRRNRNEVPVSVPLLPCLVAKTLSGPYASLGKKTVHNGKLLYNGLLEVRNFGMMLRVETILTAKLDFKWHWAACVSCRVETIFGTQWMTWPLRLARALCQWMDSFFSTSRDVPAKIPVFLTCKSIRMLEVNQKYWMQIH